jgi:hypothetical protein
MQPIRYFDFLCALGFPLRSLRSKAFNRRVRREKPESAEKFSYRPTILFSINTTA